MNRAEHQIERDLRQIADRATPSPDAWTSILTRITNQNPDTETEIIVLTEDTPRSARRWPPLASAAAAVLVVGAIVIAFAVNNTNSDDAQSPSPSAQSPSAQSPASAAVATVAPTTSAAPSAETVSFTMTDANMNDVTVTAAVPTNWWIRKDGLSIYSGFGVGSAEVFFDFVSNIYTDGCQWEFVDPPIGPTVDDLVAAWAEVPDLAATAPVDVTVDGYAGKQIELTIPDYTAGECRSTLFGIFSVPHSIPPGRWATAPDQHLTMHVLDVDGTRLVIAESAFPSTLPQNGAALDAIVASIQIG